MPDVEKGVTHESADLEGGISILSEGKDITTETREAQEMRLEMLRDLIGLHTQYKEAVSNGSDTLADFIRAQRGLIEKCVPDAALLRAMIASDGKEYAQVAVYLMETLGGDIVQNSPELEEASKEPFLYTQDELLERETLDWLASTLDASSNIPKQDWKARKEIEDGEWIARRTAEVNHSVFRDAVQLMLGREKAAVALGSEKGSNVHFWGGIHRMLGRCADVPSLRDLYTPLAEQILVQREDVDFASGLLFVGYADVLSQDSVVPIYKKVLAGTERETRFGKVATRLIVKAAFEAGFGESLDQVVEVTREAGSGEEWDDLMAAAQLTLADNAWFVRAQEDLEKKNVHVDRDLLNAWRKSSDKKKLLGSVEEAIRCMRLLEQERPGAVATLQEEFGIEDFMRYPVGMLKEQYDHRDDVSIPYGIVMYPKADWNGAFTTPDLLASLSDQVKGKYQVRIYEAGSRMDVARALIKTKQRYAQQGGGKISFALIGGHGEPGGIQFGDGGEREEIRIQDLMGRGASRAGGEFFEPNATVILESCSTGQRDGIGQKMSELLSARIVAPNIPTSTKEIRVTFDENGKPNFSVVFGDGETMEYQKGLPNES